ncbi:MAG: adenosylcobalamin-dependent ribonucleoside-diphosphate reductase [Nanoarchaeota archaeon]|nr:adenosylcobalamin-dependent ribonucleoside-diphosphate reductase [Nanoarchaeota archaeon]
MKTTVKKVKKRDGRIVDFDQQKITNAIFKAAKAVGGKDYERAKFLSDQVVKILEEKYDGHTIPTVEEIQDIVEKVLIEHGHAKTAKAYILYRQKKTEIREEKKRILNKDTLDSIDKRFSVNALRVLAFRYLTKDDEGNVVESPKELFQRVAVTIGLPEILYDPRIYDKNGNYQLPITISKYLSDLDAWDKKLKIGKYALNKWHLERLISAYEEHANKGKMKVGFDEIISMIQSGAFNKYEPIFDKYFNLMVEQVFMPNTPTLINAGKKLGMLSACFTLDVEDNIESIMKLARDVALIQKAGGGTGMNFSKLRPAGDVVKSTMGSASGPISFMKIIDTVSDVIKQGGVRRGANMGILEIWHPEIEKFIALKEKEGVYENFNISVGIWEDFWEYLSKDTDYPLINPRTKKVWKYVSPRTLLHSIAYHAWLKADPGVLFFDNVNKRNVLIPARGGKIRVTNPCVTADTLILTNKGLVYANELKEGDKVWTIDGWKTIEKFYNNGIKKIKKITLANGLELKATPEHKLLTKDGWKEINNLKEGEEVRIVIECPEEINAKFESKFNGDIEEAEFLGFFCGDGSISNSNHTTLHIKEDSELVDYFKNIMERLFGSVTETKDNGMIRLDIHRKDIAEKMRDYFSLENESSSENKIVPKEILKSNLKIQRAFMRGLFSADGSVYDANGTITVALSSTSIRLLKEVQIMLLANGIFSILTNEKKEETKEIKGKTYSTKETFRILINGVNAKLFSEKIGFIGEKEKKLKEFLSNKTNYQKEHNFVKILKIEDAGEEEVFDIKAPDTFTWTTNGIYSYDCGEEPLYPYESCNLASINVAKFVIEKNGKKEFDWEGFRKVVMDITRALDNIITMNKYPIPEIDFTTKETRRIGLGIMGLADLLFELGIKYNSKEGYDFMRKLAENLTYYAFKESIELAKERGVFPLFYETDYPNGKLPIELYYRRELWSLDWDKLVDEIKKYGLRNAMVTTNAPTGSISMIADTSNGIEPIFSLVYEKSVTVGSFFYVDSVFERKLREHGLYSEELLKKISENYGSVQAIDEIPKELKDVFVTAMDIHWIDHIVAQAVLQLAITDSISKTINMPNYATVDDVKQAYIIAHEMGCKGTTVYRDGSKTKQVLKITSEKKELKIKPTPSEFAKKWLNEIINQKPWIKEFVSLEEKKEEIKVKPPVIYSEEEKNSEEVSLEKEEHKPIEKPEIEKCPACGSKNLVYEAGCVVCKDCGWSECLIS